MSYSLLTIKNVCYTFVVLNNDKRRINFSRFFDENKHISTYAE